jgi:hypothetical protein
VTFQFADGEQWQLDAETVAKRVEAIRVERLRLLGERGGLRTKTGGKTHQEIDDEIILAFGNRLFERERYADRPLSECMSAWNAARAWVTMRMSRTYKVDARTARNWVTRALGPRRRENKRT